MHPNRGAKSCVPCNSQNGTLPLSRGGLNIQVADFFSVRLNKTPARGHLAAHKHIEGSVSFSCVLNGYLQERAVFWVHGRFPKLLWVHFT